MTAALGAASFGTAWFAGDPAAEALLPAQHQSRSDRVRRVRRARRPLQPEIAAALLDQNRRRGDLSVSLRLDQLAEPVAFVVTGQQVGLFLGPLYTVMKALSAVRWAQRLEAESGVPVIPLFWLQTEDHDFEEVAQWRGPSGAGTDGREIRVRLEAPADEARVPLGERRLPSDVKAAVASVMGRLGAGVDVDRLGGWLQAACRPGVGWGDAFTQLLTEVLRGLGLLVLDPRRPAIAAGALPVHRAALAGQAALREGLEQRAETLEDAGFAIRVPIRDEALPFFHPDGPGGPRFRAARAGAGWRLAGSDATISDAEVERWLAEAPLRWSTSALLRPIVQDTLLPVAAQVVGPGEVGYLAQCEPLWRAFELEPTMLIPRARVRLVEPWAQRLGHRWQVAPDRVGPSLDATLRAMAPPAGPEPDRVRDALARGWRLARSELPELGSDVEPSLSALDTKVDVHVQRFTRKYERIRQRRDEDRVAAAERLTSAFFPGGEPQERRHGIIPFLARYGVEHVVESMAEAADAESAEVSDVNL